MKKPQAMSLAVAAAFLASAVAFDAFAQQAPPAGNPGQGTPPSVSSKGNGPGDGTGNQGVGPRDGSGYGPGAKSGNCTGSGPKGRGPRR